MYQNYRIDQYDSVYEYSDIQEGYVFVGKLHERTMAEFVKDMEKTRRDYDPIEAMEDWEFDQD